MLQTLTKVFTKKKEKYLKTKGILKNKEAHGNDNCQLYCCPQSGLNP